MRRRTLLAPQPGRKFTILTLHILTLIHISADDVYELAPTDREEMGGGRRRKNGYSLNQDRPLRHPGRWYDPRQLHGRGSRSDGVRRAENAVQLMLETDWGEQRHGEDVCDRCRANGHECWGFTQQAMKWVAYATPVCARCKVKKKSDGCSSSTYGQGS